MQSPRIRQLVPVLSVCASVVLTQANAQPVCQTVWQPGSGVAGLDGPATDAAVLPSGEVVFVGQFTLAGSTPARSVAKYNPSTGAWTAFGAGIDGFIEAVAATPNGDVFAAGSVRNSAGASVPAILRFSASTATWENISPGLNSLVRDIAAFPSGDVVAVGAFSTIAGVASRGIARYSSSSGAWSDLSAGLQTEFGVRAVSLASNGDVLVGGDFMVATSGGTARRVARFDVATETWHALGDGVGSLNPSVESVLVLAETSTGHILAGGRFGLAGGRIAANIARFDPTTSTWSTISTFDTMGLFAFSPVTAIQPLPHGDIVVGGQSGFGPIRHFRADLAAWLPFDLTQFSHSMNGEALVLTQNGDVLVGGSFATNSPTPALNVARYVPDSASWLPCSNGFDGQVNCILALDADHALVGGRFLAAAGVSARNIVRYELSSGEWTPIGTGTDNAIVTMTRLSGGDVLVGGAFSVAGGVSAQRLARINPATNSWSVLPGTFDPNGAVHSLLTLPDGHVVVGGSFLHVDALVVNNVAKFDPLTGEWSGFGLGLTGPVPTGRSAPTALAIAVLPDASIVVGGAFFMAGGVPVQNVARFDPMTSRWSSLSTGVSGSVQEEVSALLALPDGRLIVGGTFSTAGGISASGIALYDPATDAFAPVARGVFGRVKTFRFLDDGSILVGGSLALDRGGVLSSLRLAVLSADLSRWTPVSPDVEGFGVLAMAVAPNDEVLIGGQFSLAGGQASFAFARGKLPSRCAPDFNCDARANFQDVFDFVAAWFAASPTADFNGASGVSVQDIFDYLAAWFVGCP